MSRSTIEKKPLHQLAPTPRPLYRPTLDAGCKGAAMDLTKSDKRWKNEDI